MIETLYKCQADEAYASYLCYVLYLPRSTLGAYAPRLTYVLFLPRPPWPFRHVPLLVVVVVLVIVLLTLDDLGPPRFLFVL